MMKKLLKKIIKNFLIKTRVLYFVFLLFYSPLFVLSQGTYSQCSKDTIFSSYGIDTILCIPKLNIKNQKLIPVLDSIIKYADRFDFEKDSISIYFMLTIVPIKLNKEDSFYITISLNQKSGSFGNDFYNPLGISSHYGLFCYKDYLFVVYTLNKPPKLIDEFFYNTQKNEKFVWYNRIKAKIQKNGIVAIFTYYYIYTNSSFIFDKKLILD